MSEVAELELKVARLVSRVLLIEGALIQSVAALLNSNKLNFELLKHLDLIEDTTFTEHIDENAKRIDAILDKLEEAMHARV